MRRFSVLAALALSACVSEPTVSDYNGSTVKIRALGMAGTAPDAKDTALAQSMCAADGKDAKHVGTVPVIGLDYFADFVFACR